MLALLDGNPYGFCTCPVVAVVILSVLLSVSGKNIALGIIITGGSELTS